MKFRFAGACFALALSAVAAHAEDCQLKQFASLDIEEGADGVIVPVTLQGQAGGYMRLELDGIVSGISEANVLRLGLHRQEIGANLTLNLDGQRLYQKAEATIQLGGSKGDAWIGIIPKFAPADSRIVGILAMDVLNQFDLELDFAHHKLNLFSPDHCKGQVIYWTKTAPVAAVPMTLRGDSEFVIPMQLDGKDVNAEISTDSVALLNGKVAHDSFGLDNADGSHTFKMISVDGLGITNPNLTIYKDENGGCNGGAREMAKSLLTERDPVMERCYGNPDLTLSMQQLKHLRVFVAFRERMVYATAASAN